MKKSMLLSVACLVLLITNTAMAQLNNENKYLYLPDNHRLFYANKVDVSMNGSSASANISGVIGTRVISDNAAEVMMTGGGRECWYGERTDTREMGGHIIIECDPRSSVICFCIGGGGYARNIVKRPAGIVFGLNKEIISDNASWEITPDGATTIKFEGNATIQDFNAKGYQSLQMNCPGLFSGVASNVTKYGNSYWVTCLPDAQQCLFFRTIFDPTLSEEVNK